MFGFFNSGSDFVDIQVQEGVSHWRNIKSVANNSGIISMSMMEISQLYPQYRVRAVDNTGRLLDML